ncbi:MAG TPA: hypothetical protein VFU22_30645, partial [Roseiflexaceae bacterium]|nr:hypothetical protein [Roseiflexaceae bacterium]
MPERKSHIQVPTLSVPVGGSSDPQLGKPTPNQTDETDLEAVAARALQALGEGARLDRRGFMRGLS